VTRIRPTRDPLSGVTRLLVDATNVLHALSRGPDRQPPAALVGRLRGAIPPEVSIELVFDGPAERGLSGERIAGGVSVRYGGRYSADTVLITLAEEAAELGRPDSLLVVTDDVALRHAVQRRGARTAGTTWLLRRLDRPRLAAPSVANRRPPVVAQPPAAELRETGDEDRRWSPGRGATRKRGNPRRTGGGS
jgi:YacP-like NYN domain